MNLRDAIASEQEKSRPGYACGVERLLGTLDDDDRAALIDALGSEAPTSAIARALTASGYVLAYQTLQRHRRRECRCG